MTWQLVALISIVAAWTVAMNWIHSHYNYKNIAAIPEEVRAEAARKEMS